MSGIRLRAWGLGELEQVGSLQKCRLLAWEWKVEWKEQKRQSNGN